MSFKRIEGSPNVQTYRRKASVAIGSGDPATADSNGLVLVAGDVTAANLKGVFMDEVTSDSPDYAENTRIRVDIPNQSDVFLADVGTGTATAAMEGHRYDLDSDGNVDVTSTSNNVVEIVKFISASKVTVRFVND